MTDRLQSEHTRSAGPQALQSDAPGLAPDEHARLNARAKLRDLQRQLRPWRIARRTLTVVLVLILIAALALIGRSAGAIFHAFRLSDLAFLAVYVLQLCVIPLALLAQTAGTGVRIGPEPQDRWTIGKYTEDDMRRLFKQIATELPRYVRSARLHITDQRGTNAWTLFNLLWPGCGGPPVLRVSSGALHYLSPTELQAVLLHEAAHHLPANRIASPGGWLLLDTVLITLAFLLSPLIGASVAIAVFVCSHVLLAVAVTAATARVGRQVEHACDLFAASRLGVVPTANLLLKTGEEAELSEIILARAAKHLLHVTAVDTDDLILAFEMVRPHGRIFYDNLFQHASAVIQSVHEQVGEKNMIRKPSKINADLNEFVRGHRAAKKRRIRWRTFDHDHVGDLDAAQLQDLAHELKIHPQHALIATIEEANPTTHPPVKQRFVLLADCLSSALPIES